MELSSTLLSGATFEYSQKMNKRVPNALIAVADQQVEQVMPLLHKSVGFVEKTSRIFGEEFGRQVAKRKTNSQLIMNILKCNNSHLPQFALFDSATSQPYLSAAGLGDLDILSNNLLLVFQFPEIVARWQKRQYEPEPSDKNITVSWKNVGRNLKHVVWDSVNLYSLKKLNFDRINGIGEHNFDFYYYAWELSLPEKGSK